MHQVASGGVGEQLLQIVSDFTSLSLYQRPHDERYGQMALRLVCGVADAGGELLRTEIRLSH